MWGALHDGYGQSKWVAEMMVREAQDRRLPVAIMRPGNMSARCVGLFACLSTPVCVFQLLFARTLNYCLPCSLNFCLRVSTTVRPHSQLTLPGNMSASASTGAWNKDDFAALFLQGKGCCLGGLCILLLFVLLFCLPLNHCCLSSAFELPYA